MINSIPTNQLDFGQVMEIANKLEEEIIMYQSGRFQRTNFDLWNLKIKGQACIGMLAKYAGDLTDKALKREAFEKLKFLLRNFDLSNFKLSWESCTVTLAKYASDLTDNKLKNEAFEELKFLLNFVNNDNMQLIKESLLIESITGDNYSLMHYIIDNYYNEAQLLLTNQLYLSKHDAAISFCFNKHVNFPFEYSKNILDLYIHYFAQEYYSRYKNAFTNYRGDTLLHIFVKNIKSLENFNTIQQKMTFINLIQSMREHINIINDEGNTALYLLLKNQDLTWNIKTSLLKSLFDTPDLDVNTQNSKKNNVLHLVAENFHLLTNNNLLELHCLLENKELNLNAQNIHGNTALHLIVLNQIISYDLKEQIIQKISSCAAVEINIQNQDGNTIPHLIVADPSLPSQYKFSLFNSFYRNDKFIDVSIKNKKNEDIFVLLGKNYEALTTFIRMCNKQNFNDIEMDRLKLTSDNKYYMGLYGISILLLPEKCRSFITSYVLRSILGSHTEPEFREKLFLKIYNATLNIYQNEMTKSGISEELLEEFINTLNNIPLSEIASLNTISFYYYATNVISNLKLNIIGNYETPRLLNKLNPEIKALILGKNNSKEDLAR